MRDPRRSIRTIVVVALIALGVAPPATRAATAPATTNAPAVPGASAPPAPRLGDSLRTDPQVRAGTLPNGLRWFVRKNARPEHRVALRLAVDAGSNLEADDQQGLAHFVEHMNFNGSTHFKPDELVKYLESIGLRFGADANAYTSFDETIYMLDVPTDRDTLLDRGLEALSDFAGRATLTDTEIQKERGVVLEEWRLGRGAQERLLRKQFPVLFHGSRYADRLPIGKPEIIEHGDVTRLRDYYRDWYTPDHMAVIAVGDIAPARMDSLIRVHFGDLSRPNTPRPPRVFDIPPHPETRINIATDKEATGSEVAIYYKRPRRAFATVADFRRGLVEGLYGDMLNSRLDEIAHRADAPFLNAGAYDSPLGRTLDAYILAADVTDGGLEKGLTGVLQEVARVRQHGFLASELKRAKDEVRAQNERAYAEREKSESDRFASRLVTTFLTGDSSPGIEKRYALTRALLDGVTLAEINALTPRLVHDDNRVVLVTAPEKPGATVPTEAAVRTILADAARAKVAAWVDHAAGRTLGSDPQKAGTITARRVIDEIGVTVLTLSNGVEVWLKPTDFKADEILLTAYAPGGYSLADSADFLPAWIAPSAVGAMGVGDIKAVDLDKLTAGHIVGAPASIGAFTQAITGSTRPADLETELKLIQLTFAGPTRDPDAFVALKKNFHAVLADRANNPEQVFQDTVTAVNTGRFYMQRVPTADQVDSVRLEPVLNFFRQRYANAADFTFFFAGTFSVDSIAPVLARYLGSLSSQGRRLSTFVPRGPHFPAGVRTVTVRKGVEPKSSTRITFFSSQGLEELDLHRARACATILTDHLRERLREMLGGTYGASASFGYLAPVPGYSTMSIAFGCAPENVETMVAATLDEVKKLCDAGPSAEDLEKDQAIERRELEVNVRQNAYWTGSLQTTHLLGWDPRRIAKRRERIDLLTTENLRQTFRTYFPLDHYTVITLLPEATGPPKSDK
jgi:zinc protease